MNVSDIVTVGEDWRPEERIASVVQQAHEKAGENRGRVAWAWRTYKYVVMLTMGLNDTFVISISRLDRASINERDREWLIRRTNPAISWLDSGEGFTFRRVAVPVVSSGFSKAARKVVTTKG